MSISAAISSRVAEGVVLKAERATFFLCPSVPVHRRFKKIYPSHFLVAETAVCGELPLTFDVQYGMPRVSIPHYILSWEKLLIVPGVTAQVNLIALSCFFLQC